MCIRDSLNNTKLEVWLPEPLGVATCMEKSLIILMLCSTLVLSLLFTFRLVTKMCSPVANCKTIVCVNVHNTIDSCFMYLGY